MLKPFPKYFNYIAEMNLKFHIITATCIVPKLCYIVSSAIDSKSLFFDSASKELDHYHFNDLSNSRLFDFHKPVILFDEKKRKKITAVLKEKDCKHVFQVTA